MVGSLNLWCHECQHRHPCSAFPTFNLHSRHIERRRSCQRTIIHRILRITAIEQTKRSGFSINTTCSVAPLMSAARPSGVSYFPISYTTGKGYKPAASGIRAFVMGAATTDIRIYSTYQGIGRFRSRSVDFRTIETAGDGFIDSVTAVTEFPVVRQRHIIR
jgi:hypothetical protein